MTVDFNEKICVVTGAGRGIGRAICEALLNKGATVVAAARTEAQLNSLATKHSEKVVPFPADLSVEKQVTALFVFIRERFGKLDILVNNAGHGQGGIGSVKDTPTEMLDLLYGINLRGTFLCCREAMRLMVPQRLGTIINISSIAGLRGFSNQGIYCATKHAAVGLAKALAKEAQTNGIRICSVHPGRVETEMLARSRAKTDPRDLLQPEDVAQTVMMLLSLPDRVYVEEIIVTSRYSVTL